MNVIFVRVRGYDVLIIRKRFLCQLLRQAVCFFRSNVILRVKAVLEVVILPAVKLLRLAEKFGGFGKLPGIVAVIIERVGRYNGSFLFIGDVINRLSGFALAATAFEQWHILTLLTDWTARKAVDKYFDIVAGLPKSLAHSPQKTDSSSAQAD